MEQKIRNIIYEILKPISELNKISNETHLVNDLCADSLDYIFILVELGDEFSITITDEEAEDLKTIQDFIDCVGRKLR